MRSPRGLLVNFQKFNPPEIFRLLKMLVLVLVLVVGRALRKCLPHGPFSVFPKRTDQSISREFVDRDTASPSE